MSVTINTQAMKTRETPNDQWQPVMIMTEAEVNAVVQDTAPTGSEKVWFDTSDETEVTVPTMTELNALSDTFEQRVGLLTAQTKGISLAAYESDNACSFRIYGINGKYVQMYISEGVLIFEGRNANDTNVWRKEIILN